MRWQKIGFAAIVTLGTGFIALWAFQFSVSSPPEPPLPPLSPSPQSNPLSGGRVVADDDLAGAEPFQHIASEPDTAPTFASRSPIQKNAEKYVVIDNIVYPLRVYKTMLTPNDPSVSQWWVDNARLKETWDTPVGSNPTLLAVIDTGFGLGHEEFADRWYTNSGESGTATAENPSTLNCTDRSLAISASCNLIDDDGDGTVDNETGSAIYENPSRLNCTAQSKPLTKDCNRIDDDGNGYVDDVRGWDFINFDNSVQAGELNPSGSGTTHGTSVAGVAAATGNNAKGIAGVDWNTKILPIQALDDDSYGDTRSVGRSILYAAAQGADVISISLGSDLPDDYVQQAVQTAIAAGSVVVAASGNDGCDCMVYPARYPEVVAVGALHSTNLPASFNSWGTNLDILAPGTGITTTTWTSTNQTSAYVSGVNGTSFATPLVSGILTRILSHQPTATPLQLIAALTENTNRMSLSSTTPHSTTLGHGKVDGLKVTQRMTTAKSPVQLYAFGPISKGDFHRLTASEIINGQVVQGCETGTVGTTMMYDLTKTASRFFSISKSEVNKAQKAGYSAATFAYACMQQPHDTASAIRTIDLFNEFRNIYRPAQ